MGLRIYATPDPNTPGMLGEGLSDGFDRDDTIAHANGYSRAKGYISINDLIAKIQGALITNPNECLEYLEITAHGSPSSCDGVVANTLATIGAKLAAWHSDARLCDEVSIYLSGCNTGVRTSAAQSLAQLLSSNTPTEAADRVRITVYGSVGYISGSIMEGNAKTVSEFTVNDDYFPPYPDVRDRAGNVISPGSTTSQGASSFRAFREGSAV